MTQRDMIISLMSDGDMIGKRVKIRHTDTKAYLTQGLIGKCGTVKKVSSGKIGVIVDGQKNLASSYGTYWFERSELDF